MKHYIPVILIATLVISCKNKETNEQIFNNDSIPVSVIPITQDSISSEFSSPGYFTTDDEAQLSFKNGGIINKIYVGEGDRIRAGQVLASVKGIETDAVSKQAELNYEKARRDYERASNLYRDSVATLENKQNAKTALNMAEQQRAMADFNRRQSNIIASSDGVVLKRFLNEGQMVGPGTPVFLVNPTSNQKWLFKTGVSDHQWAALQVGDRAEVNTNAFADDVKLGAIVFKKNEGVDPQTGAFTIKLKLESHKGVNLAAGLFGKATFYPSKKISAWKIPYDAVLDGDLDKGYVFITNDKQHAKKVPVHILRLEHNHVIIDGGLEDAGYLIISGSAYLTDGSAIKVQDQ